MTKTISHPARHGRLASASSRTRGDALRAIWSVVPDDGAFGREYIINALRGGPGAWVLSASVGEISDCLSDLAYCGALAYTGDPSARFARDHGADISVAIATIDNSPAGLYGSGRRGPVSTTPWPLGRRRNSTTRA